MKSDFQILVIGGGASGLMAAIAAAQAGAKVCVVEQAERVGRSILATGNGRCNLSNQSLDDIHSVRHYNRADFVADLIERYDCTAVRNCFERFGLLTVADSEGRVYPQTNSAVSVLDVLMNRLKVLGVELLTGIEVGGVLESASGGFDIAITDGSIMHANRVIITSGRGILHKTVAGHKYVRQTPVLGPLQTNTDPLKGLDGVRVRCTASLLRINQGTNQLENIAIQSGELLFRKYGLSGILIFDLSSIARIGDLIGLDFMDNYQPQELLALLEQRAKDLVGYNAQQFLDGILHPRLALAVLRSLDIQPDSGIKSKDLQRLALAMQNFALQVSAGPSTKQAQVMAGGLDVWQFDPQTLESLKTPGLFACGEALDIDGACGGYNLHWAWISGWQAGKSAAS
jgi:predicted Rossmann fold flavoprotein